jgi:hypothetical protein
VVQQRRKAKQQQIERRLLVRQSSEEEQAGNVDRCSLPRDRRSKRRHFYVTKYGEREARCLAKLARAEMVKQILG